MGVYLLMRVVRLCMLEVILCSFCVRNDLKERKEGAGRQLDKAGNWCQMLWQGPMEELE